MRVKQKILVGPEPEVHHVVSDGDPLGLLDYIAGDGTAYERALTLSKEIVLGGNGYS